MTLPPSQNVVGPLAAIVGLDGGAVTFTVVGSLATDVQPPAFVTWTVNVPEFVTTIDCVVAPFDQR